MIIIYWAPTETKVLCLNDLIKFSHWLCAIALINSQEGFEPMPVLQ